LEITFRCKWPELLCWRRFFSAGLAAKVSALKVEFK